jgi:hypothetical protein
LYPDYKKGEDVSCSFVISSSFQADKKKVHIVSPRQVEWIVKAANQFQKTLGTADKTADIVCDYSKFNVVNVSTGGSLVEHQSQRIDLQCRTWHYYL